MSQKDDPKAEQSIIDQAAEEDVAFTYSMTSWGADYALETLVQRLQKEIIFVPPFQRNYVWKLAQASRFMESLLLGLPVPGVFLYKEEDTGRLLIVDGQQRLQTIKMFFEGLFDKEEFSLSGVTPSLQGKTYRTLSEEQRNNLNDSIIHATIVRQDAPEGDSSSIYQIFERLNTGGTQLQPQEIRASIFYGRFSQFLNELNETPSWRVIYGEPSPRMKDQELILRFLAFRFSVTKYERPLNNFLNQFMKEHRRPKESRLAEFASAFQAPSNLFAKAVGTQAFRPKATLNAAVLDSMMVGLSNSLEIRPEITPQQVAAGHAALLNDPEYLEACSRATGDKLSIDTRFAKALNAFSGS